MIKNHAQHTYEQPKSRCVCVCKHFEVLTPTDGGSSRKQTSSHSSTIKYDFPQTKVNRFSHAEKPARM